jgi:hypothetical protein
MHHTRTVDNIRTCLVTCEEVYSSSQKGRSSSSSSSPSPPLSVGVADGTAVVLAGALDGCGVGAPDAGAGGTCTPFATQRT